MNSGNGLASSNSNLFVFKNGWTTTMNKDQSLTGPGMFKSRPQSSHNYARRQRNLVQGSERRVWKYNQSNNELVPGIQSLNQNKTQSNFNVHHINKPSNTSSSNRMAISGSGYVPGGGVKQPTSFFKTSSNQNEINLQATSEHVMSLRESKEALNDTQNSNLINLNQSAAARQSKNFILTNPEPTMSNQTNAQGWAKGGRSNKNRMLMRATSASVKSTVPNRPSRQSAYEISGPTQVRRPEADSQAIEFGYQKQMNNLFKVISKPDLANQNTRRTEGTTVETTI